MCEKILTIDGDLFETIEAEYDIAVFGEAYDEYVASGEKSCPISELWKELNI